MNHTLRTLLLSATALAALATAATAAPPPTTGATSGMASMHASATTMHAGGMRAMHTAMTADPEGHEAMLDDPAMQAHMAQYGLDAEQMRRWHETGASLDQMHEELAEQGIDVDAMQADCPMSDGAMASMHGDGGHGMGDHHRAVGGDQ